MKRELRFPVAFTGLQNLAVTLAKFRSKWLVSIVDPDTVFEISDCGAKRLHIEHHDITAAIDGYIHPEESHLRKLIEFGARRHENDRFVVHCQMGYSRSAAVALIMLAQSNPGHEIDVAMMLRKGAPHCHPNRLMIEIADRLLRCEGRLIAALNAMGEPTVLGHLRAYYAFSSRETP